MRPGKRFGLSAIEKNDIWRRWKRGETLHEMGRTIHPERHNALLIVSFILVLPALEFHSARQYRSRIKEDHSSVFFGPAG